MSQVTQDKQRQEGFTILELMIATTVFSLVLMVCLAGIMQITRMYYQGVTQVRTQEVSRALIDEIGESIRFSKDPIAGPFVDSGASADPDVQHICIGRKRYTYALDRQLSQNPDAANEQKRHVLWVDQPGGACTSSADLDAEDPSGGLGGDELIAENMRLSAFEITELSNVDQLYRINVTVVFGDTDLIEKSDTPVTCKSSFVGSEFCAVATSTLIVGRRL